MSISPGSWRTTSTSIAPAVHGPHQQHVPRRSSIREKGRNPVSARQRLQRHGSLRLPAVRRDERGAPSVTVTITVKPRAATHRPPSRRLRRRPLRRLPRRHTDTLAHARPDARPDPRRCRRCRSRRWSDADPADPTASSPRPTATPAPTPSRRRRSRQRPVRRSAVGRIERSPDATDEARTPRRHRESPSWSSPARVPGARPDGGSDLGPTILTPQRSDDGPFSFTSFGDVGGGIEWVVPERSRDRAGVRPHRRRRGAAVRRVPLAPLARRWLRGDGRPDDPRESVRSR